MNRLLIVSNRLPFTLVRREGKFDAKPSAGGVATGLGSVHKASDSLWIGWCGLAAERLGGHEEEVQERLARERCRGVFLSQSDIEGFYFGFSNKTIWPLFHYFQTYTAYNDTFWKSYVRVNRAFCDEVVKVARSDDIIWIHDYHLLLLPGMIRAELPDATVGFFLHIPFASSEVFRMLPWRKEITEGMLGADLVGFHTYDYVRHFNESVRRVLGCEQSLGYTTVGDRVVRVDAFPMGIDYKRFSTAGELDAVKTQVDLIRKQVGDARIILSIDRLDYTKGIPPRLEVFDGFLKRYPEYRGKVTLIMVAVPSRTGVEHYRLLKRRVDELVGRINGKYGSLGWVPVLYLYRSVPFEKLIALYSLAEVALVTPLRDGMNLIAKEFVAGKTDGKGVLILSETAGAAKELGEALIVNPNNEDEIIEAVVTALNMPEQEQIERNRTMQDRLARYSIGGWVGDFMARLENVKMLQKERGVKRLGGEAMDLLVRAYAGARRRLILLDYDGTLVPFSDWPRKAVPTGETIPLIEGLAQDERNRVVIVSGRDKETLEDWFGKLGIGLVAEHGVWVKEPGKTWLMVGSLKDDWKSQVRPLLELYVDRTPGSFIEEKSYSLGWHYRRSDPDWGSLRARELRDDLADLTANMPIGILEGSKVIEVKDVTMTKGRAVSRWLDEPRPDFILAAGDDWTDEEMFGALPDYAYTIIVGRGASRARFYIESYPEVRALLRRLKEQTCAA